LIALHFRDPTELARGRHAAHPGDQGRRYHPLWGLVPKTIRPLVSTLTNRQFRDRVGVDTGEQRDNLLNEPLVRNLAGEINATDSGGTP